MLWCTFARSFPSKKPLLSAKTGEVLFLVIINRAWYNCGDSQDSRRGKMISIEEIAVENIEEFWKLHLRYLINDGIVEDEEDIAYFSGDEYRGIIKAHMIREIDKHHMVYFVDGNVRIGAAQYNTYQSEDGKCFILDFWVFPEFRGNGTGHRCFYALEDHTRLDGAKYYEINSQKENSIRFWKSIGFEENGKDEYDMPLFIKR